MTDQLLRKALSFADQRGWFDGAGSPEDRIIAARLRELAGERWAEPEPTATERLHRGGLSATEIAAELGVHRATVHRRLADP